ncbi:SDR family oxidoreductase [Neogemmobacter tilapiae]|uniref:SDR family oxidoreductase n=1 Tax=Neogemmobacter tilapiae TaxID=875041 RepID=A0A918TE13_9RHOB|nr:SDR family oxidoreductase [Gemmobacter tilapiae]GHC44563.1 hypothetical protein GCM10007315_02230 [Gemmobacter tilapiae]
MRKVLILGADGFIGRTLAFVLREKGFHVLAHGRHVGALAGFGFEALSADLNDTQCHDPAFWAKRMGDADLVIATGLLTGSEASFRAVHELAPKAALAACQGRAVLISAVGIEADTAFARWRRVSEQAAQEAGATVLRAGLVLGDTSYGGSSMLRALAALPLATAHVGNGQQKLNPIHADDLAQVLGECLEAPPGVGPWEVGGPEEVTQKDLIALIRQWLGLRPVRGIGLPLPLARFMGRVGDVLRLGPLSATSVAQLEKGLLADPTPLLAHIRHRPAAVSQFLFRRPPGTQDLWHARLYLQKPLVRLTLALLWLISGLQGLFTPGSAFLPLLPLPETLGLILARAGGLVDLALAAALLGNWRPVPVALAQLIMVAGYTLGLSILAPTLWLDPFGALLKNLPILTLILVHLSLIRER